MLHESMTRDALLNALARHIGRENGVTAKGLVIEIIGASSPALERQLRACVERLRDEGIAVCADPAAGYHIARDAAELARPGLTGQSRLLL